MIVFMLVRPQHCLFWHHFSSYFLYAAVWSLRPKRGGAEGICQSEDHFLLKQSELLVLFKNSTLSGEYLRHSIAH